MFAATQPMISSSVPNSNRAAEGEQSQRYLAAKDQGDFDIAAVIAGECAGLIYDVRSAAEIIQSMIGQAAELMRTQCPHPMPWSNELACERALPTMEGAVTRLIRYDASALELFGTTTGGPLNPGFFVSTAECWSAEPRP